MDFPILDNVRIGDFILKGIKSFQYCWRGHQKHLVACPSKSTASFGCCISSYNSTYRGNQFLVIFVFALPKVGLALLLFSKEVSEC